MTDDEYRERLSPAELRVVREYLGLTLESLAGMLDVRPDTVRKWEYGRAPIPYRIREDLEKIEAYTATAVGEMVTALQDARDPAVLVPMTDEQLHDARPDMAHLPARWYRHVIARAVHEVPGVELTQP